MSPLGFSKAFATYGAKLVNHNWAVSAIAEDGSFVMSCWTHYMKTVPGKLVYKDRLSRWNGNALGNDLLRKHLTEAFKGDYPVRYLAAKAEDPDLIDKGPDASKVKKTFSVRPDLVGKIVSFDGDNFSIEFVKAAT